MHAPSIFLSVFIVFLSVLPVNAFWRMVCSIIQTGRVDPIVSPGTISSHAHKISGPSNFGISSTYDTLVQAQCTSCEITKDKSAYWTPQLYYKHENGSVEIVPGAGTVICYLGRGENRTNIQPFPPGFRMLSGDNGARSFSPVTTYLDGRPIAERVSFLCLGYEPQLPEQPYMFRTDCPAGLRAQIQFQSCWNGRDLWKPDQSHVAYMSQIDNGVCPPTHPNQLAQLFYETLYDVNGIQRTLKGFFMFANGDATGYGYHGDFQNGWDMDLQTRAMRECINLDESGTIDECPPLREVQDPYYASNCPQRPPIIQEQVTGLLDKLPGCNFITGYSFARVAGRNCPAGVNPTVPEVITPVLKPGPGTVYKNWTYLGCAQDSPTRALNGAKFGDDDMTIDLCLEYCAWMGYGIAGLEYSRECWCDNITSSSNPLLNDTTCTTTKQMVCSGNGFQFCGGPNFIVMFNHTFYLPGPIDNDPAPPNPTSTSTPFDLSTVYIPNNSTIANGRALYQGCFSEIQGRVLNGSQLVNSTGMTNELCASYCMTRNFAFFATEYFYECYCGNTRSSTSALRAATECDTPCRGNTSQPCGGSSRLSLWRNDDYITPINPQRPNNQYTFVGCFTDTRAGRALGVRPSRPTTDAFTRSDPGMSVEICASICFNKGFAWMGVEFGAECYCNNDGPINEAQTAPGGECDMLCGGNIGEFCGGRFRINVYRRVGEVGGRWGEGGEGIIGRALGIAAAGGGIERGLEEVVDYVHVRD